MRVEFDGQDYTFYLDQKENELERVRTQSLEAQLVKPFGQGDWGKRAVLEFGENNGSDGIRLEFFPPEAEGVFDRITEVRVKMNQRAWDYVRERGQFGTRYLGGDKIEIINRLPCVPAFV